MDSIEVASRTSFVSHSIAILLASPPPPGCFCTCFCNIVVSELLLLLEGEGEEVVLEDGLLTIPSIAVVSITSAIDGNDDEVIVEGIVEEDVEFMTDTGGGGRGSDVLDLLDLGLLPPLNA